ncbi:MAG: hypothetical protein E6117_03400, partial [Finegoldia magna]
VFLFKLTDLIKSIKAVLADNKKDIDRSIGEVPQILDNVTGITNKADRLIGDVSPDVRNITNNVSNTLSHVESVSSNVSNTVDYVAESVTDTATNIKYGFLNSTDYVGSARDIINFVKSLAKR